MDVGKETIRVLTEEFYDEYYVTAVLAKPHPYTKSGEPERG